MTVTAARFWSKQVRRCQSSWNALIGSHISSSVEQQLVILDSQPVRSYIALMHKDISHFPSLSLLIFPGYFLVAAAQFKSLLVYRTAWAETFLRLIVPQLVMKFPSFYGTQGSWPRSQQPEVAPILSQTQPVPTSRYNALKSILRWTPCLSTPVSSKWSLSFRFPTKVLCACLFSSPHATCPAHLSYSLARSNNVRCTVHTLQCTLCDAHPTVHTLQYTPYSTHHSVHTLQYTPYSAHQTVHTVQCTPYSAHPTVHTLQCTPYSAHRIVHTIQCTPYSAHHAVHTIKLLITQLFIASSEPLPCCVPVFSSAHCFYTQIVLTLCSSHKMTPSFTSVRKNRRYYVCVYLNDFCM